MNRSTKIIKFLFWTNNVIFLSLLAGCILLIIHGNQFQNSWMLLGACMLVLSGAFGWYQSWYLKNRLGVKSLKDEFYFVDDEREKQIHFKVLSEIAVPIASGIMFLFFIVFSMAIMPHTNIKIYGIVILTAMTLIGIIANYKYYSLWKKYNYSSVKLM